MLLGSHAELVVEGVVPDLLHVVPVGHDAVLNGVLQGENATLALSLVTDVRVLLAHTHHHALMSGSSDDGGKDSARSVVSSESGLAHARSIVNHQRSNVVVTHLRFFAGIKRNTSQSVTALGEARQLLSSQAPKYKRSRAACKSSSKYGSACCKLRFHWLLL